MRKAWKKKIAVFLVLGLAAGVTVKPYAAARGIDEDSVAAPGQEDFLLPAGDMAAPEYVIERVEESEEDNLINKNGLKRDAGSSSPTYPALFARAGSTYGYQHISGEMQKDYDTILSSVRTVVSGNKEVTDVTKVNGESVYRMSAISVSHVGSLDELYQLWNAFLYDHPELYWLQGGISIGVDSSDRPVSIFPWVDSAFTSDAKRDAMDEVITGEVAGYETEIQGQSDVYEKVRIIHDKIIDTIDYSYDDTETEKTHSIVGVFDKEQYGAVCEGYAKAFSFLLNYFDIPQIYIVGNAVGSVSGPHAWNAVSFDGGNVYYDMDVTWDDTSSIRYYYFAMNDDLFSQKHEPDDPDSDEWQYELPVMGKDNQKSYYYHYGANIYEYEKEEWLEQTRTACANSPYETVYIMCRETTYSQYVKTIGFTGALSRYSANEYSDEVQGGMYILLIPQSMYYTPPETTATATAGASAPAQTQSGEGADASASAPAQTVSGAGAGASVPAQTGSGEGAGASAPAQTVSGEGAGASASVPAQTGSGEGADAGAPAQTVSGEGAGASASVPAQTVSGEGAGASAPVQTQSEVSPTASVTANSVPAATVKPVSTELPVIISTEETEGKTESTATSLPVGTKFKHAGSKAVYKVTGSHSVSYVRPQNKKSTSVTIPAAVKNKGVAYQVVAIEKSACKNAAGLKSVVIGKNVKRIGNYAFYRCKALRKVKILSQNLSKNSLGKKVFAGNSKKCVYKCLKKYRKYLRKAGAVGKLS